MPETDQTTKQRRKELVYNCILRHDRGIPEKDIADELNLGQRSVNTYLRELEIEGKVEREGHNWVAYPQKRTRLRQFEISPEEAMTLYLATRLLVKQHDKRNESAETALVKLAEVLTGDVGVGNEIYQAALELAHRPGDVEYSRIFRAVMQSYIYRRKLRMTYEPLNGEPFETLFAPYLLEPSAIGYATYVIGHSEAVDALRTYKLERIQSAVLTAESYNVPGDFPGLDYLRSAWSIVSGEEVVAVKLRFAARVAKRVRETVWHPSQAIADDPEHPGGCIWTAQIADLTDFTPWARSWGADAEVLAPVELREALVREVRRMGRVYEIGNATLSLSYQHLWGKIDRKTKDVHRLVYHMVDVGQVASALWQVGLHQNIRQALADWLSLGINETGKLIAFLAALHDLGKASPAFQDHQAMREPLKSRIKEELQAAGFQFADRASGEKHTRHEIFTTWALRANLGEGLLHDVCGFDSATANWLAQVLGGHHGSWPRSDHFGPKITSADKGSDEWTQARTKLVDTMMRLFDPPAVSVNFDENCTHNNIMLTYLSAIVSVADWIGSDDDYFPLEENIIPLSSYIRHSKQHAQCALKSVNWESPVEMPDFAFDKAFPFQPTEAQERGIAALANISLPAIAIIEAPMGTGKTELAFAVYAHWAKQMQSAGLYVAMPTTATSNQMHGRAAQFLTHQLGKSIEPLLIHSQALLRKVSTEKAPLEEQERDGDTAAAQSWFLPRKQSLLVPYGVGTVDQALMSILQTKHFFVRLLGLSHKVVVFDEVHAYDAYMSELFERLLQWLRAINTSVIILSATLPDKTRQKLIQAYTGATTSLSAEKYPQITFAPSNGPAEVVKLNPPPTKELGFGWLTRDVEGIIKTLSEALKRGGCAAVICNTIGYAQEIFNAIQNLPNDQKLCDADNLILFHARFPMAWREGIEEKVLRKLGPGTEKGKANPDRPDKIIVVATQVIEQSLDLDFDVMISDHAPVDLLLQRAGRLHRHAANEPRCHPYHLWITVPVIEDAVPHFERKEYVYDEYVLLRSWLALQEQSPNIIQVPDDMPDLIEYVYGDQPLLVSPEMSAALEKTKQAMDKDDFDERAKARDRRVAKPQDERFLWKDNLELEEDDPRVHKTFRALTRSGDPGLSVICLHRIAGQLHLEPEVDSPIYDPKEEPNSDLVRELARRSVNIRRRKIEDYLLEKPSDDEIKTILRQWKYIAALRYHRVVIFENGRCPLEGTGFVLQLDKENQLGLQILQEAK